MVANERGAVDNNANVDFANMNLQGSQYDPTPRVQATFRAGYFHEERDNGKASTIDGTKEANDTTLDDDQRRRRVSGCRTRARSRSTLFGDIETFRSNFLAVPAANPPRSIGRMTLNQRVPTDSASAAWRSGRGRSAG